MICGLLAGGLSVLLTGAVYAAEDSFMKLPIHWMWWPAIGGLVVGLGGLIFPQALGVGYDTIGALLKGDVARNVILGVLLVSGFFRSLQYTSLNTVAYAEIGSSRMSAATSAASMMQQLSNGLGVAFGALMLQIARHWSGTLTVTDFHAAFGCAGLVALAAVVIFLRLDPAAGAEISGHRSGAVDVKPSSA